MHILKRYRILLLVVLAVLALGALLVSEHTWAQQQKFQADKHKDRGLDCAACHKETPPSQAVPSAVCKNCHDPEKLAMKSAEKLGRQNPHDNHLGDIPCESCHHGHKPSEDACAKCHNFGFKVP